MKSDARPIFDLGIATAPISALVVNKAGMASSVQDAGRKGLQQYGLAQGGVMDEYAANWANLLVGNPIGTATVEVTLGNIELISKVDSKISVTGAEVALTINDQLKALWTSHRITAGDKVSLSWSRSGCRSYIAITGGFFTPKQFGSQSTVVREKTGGIDGRWLMKPDLLSCKTYHHIKEELDGLPELSVPDRYRVDYQNKFVARVLLGSQADTFSEDALAKLFNSDYKVLPNSDRMGIRLQGECLISTLKGIQSEAIPFGTIQVPPDGQPIIMMKDRQTLGGYPKLGSILPVDAWRLSQVPPGQTLRFAPVTIEAAQSVMLRHYDFFADKAVSLLEPVESNNH